MWLLPGCPAATCRTATDRCCPCQTSLDASPPSLAPLSSSLGAYFEFSCCCIPHSPHHFSHLFFTHVTETNIYSIHSPKKQNDQQAKIWEFTTPLGWKKSQTTHLKLSILKLKLGVLRLKPGCSETQNTVFLRLKMGCSGTQNGYFWDSKPVFLRLKLGISEAQTRYFWDSN